MSQLAELSVIRDTDGRRIGKIKPAVGMMSDKGKIIKINDVSVVVRQEGLEETVHKEHVSIWYTDAIYNDGFPSLNSHREERKAAAIRKFKAGEALWNEKGEQADSEALSDEWVAAGYKFARSVEVLRELAIEGLY